MPGRRLAVSALLAASAALIAVGVGPMPAASGEAGCTGIYQVEPVFNLPAGVYVCKAALAPKVHHIHNDSSVSVVVRSSSKKARFESASLVQRMLDNTTAGVAALTLGPKQRATIPVGDALDVRTSASSTTQWYVLKMLTSSQSKTALQTVLAEHSENRSALIECSYAGAELLTTEISSDGTGYTADVRDLMDRTLGSAGCLSTLAKAKTQEAHPITLSVPAASTATRLESTLEGPVARMVLRGR